MHYAPLSFNCLYDCEYCYLQGLYPSANIVLFVNIKDYQNAIDEKLKQDSLYLCLSYDCDILAMESVFGLATEFIEFAKNRPNLTLEIRTKSANTIKNITPAENVILAWSLSPQNITAKYEIGAPSLQARINAAQKALKNGWRVRLCLEPILAVDNWQIQYSQMIGEIFKTVDGAKIDSINIDSFRMSKPILKRIQKMREESVILNEDLVEKDDIVSYDLDTIAQMKEFLADKLLQWIQKDKIFI